MLCKTCLSGELITASKHCGTAQHEWLIIIMTGCVNVVKHAVQKKKKERKKGLAEISNDTHEFPSSRPQLVAFDMSHCPLQKQVNR